MIEKVELNLTTALCASQGFALINVFYHFPLFFTSVSEDQHNDKQTYQFMSL